MKITFVGSSHGVPEPHRQCSCTMIEVAGNTYFVDMGTCAINALRTRNIPVDSVKGIFLTHMHGDHSDGLIQFVDLLTWFFRSAEPIICLPIIEAAKLIESWIQITQIPLYRSLQYRETVEGTVFDDGIIKVTAIPTQHCPKSFSYVVEAEGKAVLFTGDLRNPSYDFALKNLDKHFDLVVCESAHFNATDYLPYLDEKKVDKVCINHYSDLFLPSVFSLFEQLKQTNISTVLAMDDLEIRI